MKGFILTLVGDILLINGAIISTVGSNLVGTPDSSNIPLQTVLSWFLWRYGIDISYTCVRSHFDWFSIQYYWLDWKYQKEREKTVQCFGNLSECSSDIVISAF